MHHAVVPLNPESLLLMFVLMTRDCDLGDKYVECCVTAVCLVVGYSNAGILAAVSLGLAAVVWPSLLCLPYLLLLAGAVLAWSASAPSPAGSRSMRILQVYTGVLSYPSCS